MQDDFRKLCRIEQQSEEIYKKVAGRELSGKRDALPQELPKARQAVVSAIDENVQCYSSLSWLCYLRLPIVRRITGWLNDGMETAHHAEAFTARSREQSLNFTSRANGVLPVYDPHKVRNSAKLIDGAFVYRQLRVFQTLLTLEISFADTRRGDLPEPEPTQEQRRNLTAYNARIDQPMLLVTAGAILATAGDEDTEETTFVSIGFNKDIGKFGIGPLGLAKFKQAHSTQIVQSDSFEEIGDLLLVLKVGYIAARNAKLLDQVLRYGFISVRATMLPEFFAAAETIVAAIKGLLPGWSYPDFNATVERLCQVGIEFGYAPPVRAAGDLGGQDNGGQCANLDSL